MKKLRFTIVAALLACIFIRPELSVAAAQQAMRVWYSSVAPSLFPFLALMPLITDAQACRAYNAIFGRIMRPLFRLPGSAAPAMVIGMLAGSPGGSIGICRIASESGMQRSEARRLALALGGVSPAYLIVGAGAVLFGSVQYGIRLAAAQAMTQLILLFLLGRIQGGGDSEPVPPGQDSERHPIHGAVETVLGVAGYMMVFAIAGELITEIVGSRAGALIQLAIDLPTGLAAASNLDNIWKLPAVSAAIGFTGMCINLQNMDALRSLGITAGEYIGVRGAAAMLNCCLGLLIMKKDSPNTALPAENMPDIYVIYLLIVLCISIFPLMILTNKCFLNKRKLQKGLPNNP